MSFYGDADLDSMMQDLGVHIFVALSPGFGILDLQDQVAMFDCERGEIVTRTITLLVQTSRYPASGIAIGAIIVADGVSYTVHERLSEGDGALTKLLLRKA